MVGSIRGQVGGRRVDGHPALSIVPVELFLIVSWRHGFERARWCDKHMGLVEPDGESWEKCFAFPGACESVSGMNTLAVDQVLAMWLRAPSSSDT